MIEKIVGWRGDEAERRHFYQSFTLEETSILSAGGADIGWMTVRRNVDHIYLDEITILAPWQNNGIGTSLLRDLIQEANERGLPLRLSTARINPARRLYERLGFRIVRESPYKFEMEMDGLKK